MAQHVRMDGERHLGPNTNAAKQGMEAFGRHRASALGHKDVRGQPLLALQSAQGAYLVTLHRVDSHDQTRQPSASDGSWDREDAITDNLSRSGLGDNAARPAAGFNI